MKVVKGSFLGLVATTVLVWSMDTVAAASMWWGSPSPPPRSFENNHMFYELSTSGIVDFCLETRFCETPQTKNELTRLRNNRLRSWLVGILGVAAGAGVSFYGSRRMSDGFDDDAGIFLMFGGLWIAAGGMMYTYWSYPNQRDYMRFVNAYNHEHPESALQIK